MNSPRNRFHQLFFAPFLFSFPCVSFEYRLVSLERRVSFVDAPFTTAPLAVAVALFTFEALTRELLICEPLTSDAFIMRYSESFYRSTHTRTHTFS